MSYISDLKKVIDADEVKFVQPQTVRNDTTRKAINKVLVREKRTPLPELSDAVTIGIVLDIQTQEVQKSVLRDEIHKDPAQVAANEVIVATLNSTTPGVDIPVTSVSWQAVLDLIGAAKISTLTVDQVAQLDFIKSESVDPNNQTIIDVLATLGVDIVPLQTYKGSIADLNGWQEVKPGHIAMARAK